MPFHEVLLDATRREREALLSLPLFDDVMHGRVTRAMYIDFLTQAFHHVKHTVPLMMACGARLSDEHEWLRAHLVHYIEDEYGHHEWILDDIANSGGDLEQARNSRAALPTRMMVGYAYDLIARGNPVAFLGMVLVLEGTSVAIASTAAQKIGAALGLPKKAFTYLNSHGALDLEHVEFFRKVVNGFSDEADRTAVIDAARDFYRLYGDIFRYLHQEHATCESKQAASF
jgi:pyrroloquinoline quinone (PQQ) biosynthesis protein C